MAAVGFNGGALPDSHVYTEADWSNEQYMREKGHWYPLSKTLAERFAWAFVENNKPGFDLIVINPTLVIGPMLQPTLNTSSEFTLDGLTGKKKIIPNSHMSYVDVRDVALAQLLCFENPNASGRYVCVAGVEHWKDRYAIIHEACPKEKNPNVPTEIANEPLKAPMLTNSSKLRALNWNPLSFKQSQSDTVASIIQQGLF